MTAEYNAVDASGDLLIILTGSAAPVLPLDGIQGWKKGRLQDATQHTPRVKTEDAPYEVYEYGFLVSSAILRHACREFHEELDPNGGAWKELEVQPDGFRHKNVDGFDPDALHSVLDVVHFRNSKMPTRPSIELLAKMAVIVDSFQCREAMTFAGQLWDAEEIDIPEESDRRSLLLCLLVSSVLSTTRLLKEITPIILAQSARPLDTCGLPIPHGIVRK